MNIIKNNLKFDEMSIRTKTNKAVLHHAASTDCSVEDVHRWHKEDNGWSGIGYHLFIRKDGTIHRGRPMNTVGAHVYGENSDSIGICFEGNFEIEKMPEAQKRAGQEAVSYIKQLYPLIKFVRHKDLAATACPGKNFPFEEIVSGADETEYIITDGCIDAEDYNPKVEELQRAAIKDGFGASLPSGVDGYFGPECNHTFTNVLLKIRIEDGKSVYRHRNLTKWVQSELGFVGSDLDGKYGPDTEAAVKRYQETHDLEVDGIVGINTYKSLAKVKKQEN